MGYRIKIGNIYEIPLPDGTNAYGRLYKEYTLAIYNTRAHSYDELPDTEDYQFFVGVYKDLLTDGEWKEETTFAEGIRRILEMERNTV